MKFKTFLIGIMAVFSFSALTVSCIGDEHEELVETGTPDKSEESDEPADPDYIHPLSFSFDIIEVTSSSFKIRVTPSYLRQHYMVDLVLASEYDGKNDEEIIANYKDRTNESLYTGKNVFATAKSLMPETEYLLLTFGLENGETTSKLYRFRIKTLFAGPGNGTGSPHGVGGTRLFLV